MRYEMNGGATRYGNLGSGQMSTPLPDMNIDLGMSTPMSTPMATSMLANSSNTSISTPTSIPTSKRTGIEHKTYKDSKGILQPYTIETVVGTYPQAEIGKSLTVPSQATSGAMVQVLVIDPANTNSTPNMRLFNLTKNDQTGEMVKAIAQSDIVLSTPSPTPAPIVAPKIVVADAGKELVQINLPPEEEVAQLFKSSWVSITSLEPISYLYMILALMLGFLIAFLMGVYVKYNTWMEGYSTVISIGILAALILFLSVISFIKQTKEKEDSLTTKWSFWFMLVSIIILVILIGLGSNIRGSGGYGGMRMARPIF